MTALCAERGLRHSTRIKPHLDYCTRENDQVRRWLVSSSVAEDPSQHRGSPTKWYRYNSPELREPQGLVLGTVAWGVFPTRQVWDGKTEDTRKKTTLDYLAALWGGGRSRMGGYYEREQNKFHADVHLQDSGGVKVGCLLIHQGITLLISCS